MSDTWGNWYRAFDQASETYYYVDENSGESVWEPPVGSPWSQSSTQGASAGAISPGESSGYNSALSGTDSSHSSFSPLNIVSASSSPALEAAAAARSRRASGPCACLKDSPTRKAGLGFLLFLVVGGILLGVLAATGEVGFLGGGSKDGAGLTGGGGDDASDGGGVNSQGDGDDDGPAAVVSASTSPGSEASVSSSVVPAVSASPSPGSEESVSSSVVPVVSATSSPGSEASVSSSVVPAVSRTSSPASEASASSSVVPVLSASPFPVLMGLPLAACNTKGEIQYLVRQNAL